MSLILAAGDWRAVLAPELGGSLLSLKHAGRDVLRPAPPGAQDVLETACFPLAPYANRIADGRFTFDGAEVRLPVPPRFAPHAIHGVGWRRVWQVEHAGPARAIMQLNAGGDDEWPWRFAARQVFTLTGDGLHIVLSIENADARPMPAGLGLHPCFALDDPAILRFNARQVWLSGETLIPVEPAFPRSVQDFAGGAALPAGRLIDHCYAGWDGAAELHTGGRCIAVSADTGHVHIYAPREGGFCCIEPVTHRPDAINASGAGAGMQVLQPGEALSLRMAVSLSGPAPQRPQ